MIAVIARASMQALPTPPALAWYVWCLLVAGMAVCGTACLIILLRNGRVFQLRQRAIVRVFEANPLWQHDAALYHTVPYARMVWQFWRPLTMEEWFPFLEAK